MNGYSLDQVGRNITYMKDLVQKFLSETKSDEQFLLYIGIHDTHRVKWFCRYTPKNFMLVCYSPTVADYSDISNEKNLALTLQGVPTTPPSLRSFKTGPNREGEGQVRWLMV